MRVSDQVVQRQSSDAIAAASERLAEFQRLVATQKRVERGSQDPAAASLATVERGRLAQVDTYNAAADSATSRLTVVDGVLSGILNQLDSVQVAITASRGSSVTAAQREAQARALEGLRDGLLRDFNTSLGGTYLFAGAASSTVPFTQGAGGVVSAYQGATKEVSVDIDNGLAATVAFNGEAITKGSDPDDLFTVLNQAIAAVRANDGPALDSATAALQRAFDRVTATQSRVGASLNEMGIVQGRLGEEKRQSATRLSHLVDADLASAISGMTQADTAYRAALSAASQLQKISLMDYLK
jgi:flagellar hook-associated protein 3 FlgL